MYKEIKFKFFIRVPSLFLIHQLHFVEVLYFM